MPARSGASLPRSRGCRARHADARRRPAECRLGGLPHGQRHEHRAVGQGHAIRAPGFRPEDEDLCVVVDDGSWPFLMSLGICFLSPGGFAIHAELERVEADAADGFDETLAGRRWAR